MATIALVVLLVAWLVALTLAVVQQSRVTCPQCKVVQRQAA